jgi:hypothetical protein
MAPKRAPKTAATTAAAVLKVARINGHQVQFWPAEQRVMDHGVLHKPNRAVPQLLVVLDGVGRNFYINTGRQDEIQWNEGQPEPTQMIKAKMAEIMARYALLDEIQVEEKVKERDGKKSTFFTLPE